jgi:hypothetical protein
MKDLERKRTITKRSKFALSRSKFREISKECGIANLSAVAQLFELLICRSMYEDLRVGGRSTVSNLIEYTLKERNCKNSAAQIIYSTMAFFY